MQLYHTPPDLDFFLAATLPYDARAIGARRALAEFEIDLGGLASVAMQSVAGNDNGTIPPRFPLCRVVRA